MEALKLDACRPFIKSQRPAQHRCVASVTLPSANFGLNCATLIRPPPAHSAHSLTPFVRPSPAAFETQTTQLCTYVPSDGQRRGRTRGRHSTLALSAGERFDMERAFGGGGSEWIAKLHPVYYHSLCEFSAAPLPLSFAASSLTTHSHPSLHAMFCVFSPIYFLQ